MYPYYCGFMCFYFKLSLVRLSCVYRVVACLMLGSVAMCTGTVSLKIELLIFIGIILTLWYSYQYLYSTNYTVSYKLRVILWYICAKYLFIHL